MFSFYLDLFKRAFFAIPPSLGGNMLGLVWPAILVICGEAIACVAYGWRKIAAKWKRASLIGFSSLAACYICLFIWCAFSTNYQDHVVMGEKIAALETPPPKLLAEIALAADGTTKRGDLMVLASINLVNSIGPERPILNWKVRAVIDNETVDSAYFILPATDERSPIAHSDKFFFLERAKYCRSITEDPIPGGSNRSCWIEGLFKGKARYVDQPITVIISFDDVLSGKTVEVKATITKTLPPQLEGLGG